ncbi:hypothetical protein M2162_006936 [Streptomyces sp. SAI-041]|nr:hypothetical protein [Streptomyces sp. SAI-041]
MHGLRPGLTAGRLRPRPPRAPAHISSALAPHLPAPAQSRPSALNTVPAPDAPVPAERAQHRPRTRRPSPSRARSAPAPPHSHPTGPAPPTRARLHRPHPSPAAAGLRRRPPRMHHPDQLRPDLAPTPDAPAPAERAQHQPPPHSRPTAPAPPARVPVHTGSAPDPRPTTPPPPPAEWPVRGGFGGSRPGAYGPARPESAAHRLHCGARARRVRSTTAPPRTPGGTRPPLSVAWGRSVPGPPRPRGRTP